MTLQQPVTLPQDEVAKAVRQSQEHAVAVQPVAPRPVPPPIQVLRPARGAPSLRQSIFAPRP